MHQVGIIVYYRRKVLLALLNAFGGALSATDCHKLMFLLCQKTGEPYYDFFPHKFGAYSIVLNQDRLRLIDLGYLAKGEKVKLTRKRSSLIKVDEATQSQIESIAAEYKDIKGNALLKRTYMDFPYFATRSSVAAKILTEAEFEVVLQCKNEDETACLFTLGYEGKTIDDYINLLIANNVRVLVDVRKNPISKKFGFSKNQMKLYTDNGGIVYVHFPDLGIPSGMRQNLESAEAYQELFEYYATQILPAQEDALMRLRILLKEHKRVVLTCYEAMNESCHRSRIVDYLVSDPTFDVPVKHL